jgi:hypothetical protein
MDGVERLEYIGCLSESNVWRLVLGDFWEEVGDAEAFGGNMWDILMG